MLYCCAAGFFTKMGRRKKTFPCGHSGFGQFCHQCAEKEKGLQERRRDRAEWEATFDGDAINLREFPEHVVLLCRKKLGLLSDGADYAQLRGKRMNHDRNIISIPVGDHYRLMCRWEDGKCVPTELLSHEEYNRRKPGA